MQSKAFNKYLLCDCFEGKTNVDDYKNHCAIKGKVNITCILLFMYMMLFQTVQFVPLGVRAGQQPGQPSVLRLREAGRPQEI